MKTRFLPPLVGSLVCAAVAFAAAPQTVSQVGGRFGPTSKAQKQPKKATLTQVVGRDFARAAGDSRFCISYERSGENRPDKGSISATVMLMRDPGLRFATRIEKTKVSDRRAETCTSGGIQLEEGDILIWTLQFKGMPKMPAGSHTDFAAKVLAPGEPFGTFRLSGGGFDETVLYADGANLIFCRTDAGFADLWIRLAEQTEADGGNGPHIDIDVCNYAGGGTFSPLDPSNPSCNGARTFDIFWHDDAGTSFMNVANASQCEMVLSHEGDDLDGTFTCNGLEGAQGGDPVNVLAGAFRCVVD